MKKADDGTPILTPQEVHDLAYLAGILVSFRRSGWIYLTATLAFAAAGFHAAAFNSVPWLAMDVFAASVCCYLSRSNFRLSRITSPDDVARVLTAARGGR